MTNGGSLPSVVFLIYKLLYVCVCMYSFIYFPVALQKNLIANLYRHTIKFEKLLQWYLIKFQGNLNANCH